MVWSFWFWEELGEGYIRRCRDLFFEFRRGRIGRAATHNVEIWVI